mmetsp:Transcript_86186/g.252151  ORF Transcript_86186/g.252151 Transcript_86186/m.252151 type:complete len:256 (-) Transcript_86186:162-929(-)
MGWRTPVSQSTQPARMDVTSVTVRKVRTPGLQQHQQQWRLRCLWPSNSASISNSSSLPAVSSPKRHWENWWARPYMTKVAITRTVPKIIVRFRCSWDMWLVLSISPCSFLSRPAPTNAARSCASSSRSSVSPLRSLASSRCKAALFARREEVAARRRAFSSRSLAFSVLRPPLAATAAGAAPPKSTWPGTFSAAWPSPKRAWWRPDSRRRSGEPFAPTSARRAGGRSTRRRAGPRGMLLLAGRMTLPPNSCGVLS